MHQAPTAEAEVVEPVHEDGVRAAVAEAAQKAEEAEEAYEAKVETEAHEKTEGVPEATEVHAGATEAVEVHEVVIKPPISPPPESEPEERQGPQPKSVDRATDQGHAADADVVSGGVPSKEEIVVPVEGLPASSSDDIVNLVSMLEARPEKVSEPIVANGVKHLDDVAGEIPDEL